MDFLTTSHLEGIDQPDISKSEIKDYLSEVGVSIFLKRLLRHKQQKSILDLLGHAAVIKSELPSVGLASGFLEYFEKFKTLKTSVVSKVWATPGAYHWLPMTRMLLDVTICKIAKPKPLEDYLAFLQRPLSEGLAAHLNDFGRFALAAFLISGRDVSFEEPIQIKLPSTLPGSNLALLPSPVDPNPLEPLRLSALTPTILEALMTLQNDEAKESCSIFVQRKSGPSREVIALKMPLWKGPYGDIQVDSFEPCLTLPYVEIYPRIQDYARCRQFFTTVQKALHRLTDYEPGLVDEMSFITSSVTPMDAGTDEGQMYSGTSSVIFGGCFISATNQPLYAAEMLLHEFCHNKLRLLQDVAPQICPQQPTSCRFYSPWRDDPRPLDGIQHGLFVFSSIARFWLNIWRDDKSTEVERVLAQRRIGTLVCQLEYAIAEFRDHVEHNEYSQLFIEEICERIRALKVQTDGWAFHHIRPFFSGLLRDKSLQEMPIADALHKHRLTWETNHRV